jgi:Protein of unknown function (DUF3570)
MKRKIVLIGSLFLSMLCAKAQEKDSLYKKIRLKSTQIEFIYSQYCQDGNNSAVTGGIGTEQLTVNAPLILITKPIKDRGELSYKIGADVISSASTDRIDYVLSSASSVDLRSHLNVDYSHNFEKFSISGGTGFSIESDYFSIPVNLGVTFQNKNQMKSYSLNFRMNFDDLRYGRLNPDYYRPVSLIYPVELRYKEWSDVTNRNSYNLQFGFTQIIDKRNRIGFFPEVHLQEGLLASPFHRVYFKDDSLKVEKLPNLRIKGLFALKLNSFIGGNFVVKNKVDLYGDSFGIVGFGIENETVFKVNHWLTLKPSFRIYIQSASQYFAAYKEHSSSEQYYTSDYDLSNFRTYTTGFSIKYTPSVTQSSGFNFKSMEISYSNYQRSNNLLGHIISCAFKMDLVK